MTTQPFRRHACYHCHANPPNRHSVFCDVCLAGTRPLFFPGDRDRRKPAPPLTRLLYLTAFATTVWLIFKAAEAVSQ